MVIAIADGCGTAGARRNGIYASGGIDGVILDGILITGDKSVGNDGSTLRQNGVYFNDTAKSLIANCIIMGFIECGIHLHDFSDGNMVVNTACSNNDDFGIWLRDDSDHCLLEGNFTTGSNDGICVFDADYTRIVGNDCSNNSEAGIDLQSGSNNNVVTGNQCFTNDMYGIWASFSSENTITGNQCFDNGVHGVYVYKSSHCTVTGNGCNDNDTDGIYVKGTGTNADYNTFIGNVCYHNGDDGLDIEGGTASNYNVVDGNILINNTGTDYVDNGNQTEYWGGSTNANIELRPELDEATIRALGTPTRVNVGVYKGYSLPIGGANEELFFTICVPDRWDGESDIKAHIVCCLAQAEDTKNFKLELCWEHFTPGVDVIPATCNSVTVQTATGVAAAQYQTYMVDFTIDYDIDVGDLIIPDDQLGIRVRRVAATANEIGGEIIVQHLGVIFQRNKVGDPVP